MLLPPRAGEGWDGGGNTEALAPSPALPRVLRTQGRVAVTTPAIHVRERMLDYMDEEYDRAGLTATHKE